MNGTVSIWRECRGLKVQEEFLYIVLERQDLGGMAIVTLEKYGKQGEMKTTKDGITEPRLAAQQRILRRQDQRKD